ncbi:two-component system LytT family response regulator [Flavobacterium sp. W4I14]|nr:two-component system LytT family response regulator [Flavobacterium sp. W4I14]
MYISCVAVDDDVNGLEILRDYIPNFPRLKLINQFSCSKKALDFITASKKIDILFLDIEMPGISGLELLKLIRHKINNVIFTTAHLKYIVDSYKMDAEGFLLKPYTYTKFERTIKNLPTNPVPDTPDLFEKRDFFFVKVKGGNKRMLKIKFREVIAIEGLRNYILIHTIDQTIATHLTIIKIKEVLGETKAIIQVHRSFLISLDHITEVRSNIITMQRNIKITYGEKYKNQLLAYCKDKSN